MGFTLATAAAAAPTTTTITIAVTATIEERLESSEEVEWFEMVFSSIYSAWLLFYCWLFRTRYNIEFVGFACVPCHPHLYL